MARTLEQLAAQPEEISRRGGAFSARSAELSAAGRGPAGDCARRIERGPARPRFGRGAGVCFARRNDGREGCVRFSRPQELGSGLSRQGAGGARAYACFRAEWLNNTVNIDTGCVYGGHLTALRYPERETVSVPAKAIYYPPRRPFAPTRPWGRGDELKSARTDAE